MHEVSVIIPHRSGDWCRDRNLAWCRRQYADRWELIVEDDHGTGEWRKGPVVDAGVQRSHGQLLVIADSDIWLGRSAMSAAVAHAWHTRWSSPIGTVYRLSEQRTRRIVHAGGYPPAAHVPSRRHPAVVGGGLVILPRDAYEAVGGIDGRFADWGGEDLSFGRALDTLVGPGYRGDALAWHLWHQPMPRRAGGRASPENELLANRYLAAYLDPTATRAIISETRA